MKRRCDIHNYVSVATCSVRVDLNDVLKECFAAGQLDDLREALDESPPLRDTEQVVRDLVYELAAADNRDLAVDALIHATGIAEFECRSLRDYARKHGLTPEGFRLHVQAIRLRLNLPGRSSSLSDDGV